VGERRTSGDANADAGDYADADTNTNAGDYADTNTNANNDTSADTTPGWWGYIAP